MACKLVYNNEGQFVKALTPDGRESSLFKQILSIPHIRSVKEASELYANIFSKKMYSIIGQVGAENAKEYRESLEEAKKLDSEGMSLEEIEQRTGWYKQNNLWKTITKETVEALILKDYEVNEIKKLKDILNEDNILLQMYPQIGEYSVLFYDNSQENSKEESKTWTNSFGAFNEEKYIIGVNTVFNGNKRR